MRKLSLILGTLLLVVVGCGGNAGSEAETPDTSDAGFVFVGDTGNPPRPDVLPVDVAPDTGRDVPFVLDVPTNPDVPVEPDIPVIPDAGHDTGGPEDVYQPPEDTSGCGACPPERPICMGGRCVCTESSCERGSFCRDEVCVVCNEDEHCTAACLDCTQYDRVCAADGLICVECRGQDDCDPGYRCEGDKCVACDTDELCGPSCVACVGTEPHCDGEACVCTIDSCPAGEWCSVTGCRECNVAEACGPDCVDCSETGTPACTDGECRCVAHSQCPDGSWCDDGACAPCGADDALHCGASCAICEGAAPICSGGQCVCATDEDCPEAHWCSPTGCAPCNTSERCGRDCTACPEETPICGATGCTACELDEQCPDGTWCDSGECVACGQSDPLHCGGACAVCGGTTPDCAAGQCVCNGTSCDANYRCDAGACVFCDQDAHCGPSCAACGEPTPLCLADGSGCVDCRGDGDCAATEHCDGNVCVPNCVAPGCLSDNVPSGEDCGSAKLIGRLDAIGTAHYAGDTTDADNDDDLGSFAAPDCWDAQRDLGWRIYLLAGDRLDLYLDPVTPDFSAALKLYKGLTCDNVNDLIECTREGGDGDPQDITFTATVEGWYGIIVDGRRSFTEDHDWGEFTLDVTLTCGPEGCCCDSVAR